MTQINMKMNLVLITLLFVGLVPSNLSSTFLRNSATAPFELSAFVPIETKRLILRKINLDDVPMIFSILSEAQVVDNTAGLERYTAISQATDLVKKIMYNYQIDSAYDPILFGIIDKMTEELIGCVGFFGYTSLFSRAELGYFLSPKVWGRGFAAEAALALVDFGFANLYLNRIEATVFPENGPSVRVLEKTGMRCEGVLRQHVARNGQFRDRKIYSILRDEWCGTQKQLAKLKSSDAL